MPRNCSQQELEQLANWCRSSDRPLKELAEELMVFSHEFRVRAALAALQASIAEDDPDPQWQRPQKCSLSVEAWLENQDEESLAVVRSAVGSVEMLWNEVAGDLGQDEPTLQSATYTGWTVTQPEQRWNMVHAITGAAKAIGDDVLTAVRKALRPIACSPHKG